jgi:uncharacterized protein (DUF58 family)
LLLKLARIAWHTVLLFTLPWLIGALTGAIFDVSEVSETGNVLIYVFAAFAGPVAVVQMIAVATKVGRERRARKALGQRGFAVTVEIVERHVRVLTAVGQSLLLGSLVMVALALGLKWAQLGVLAVLGLGLVYVLTVAATVLSAFFMHAGPEAPGRHYGRIEREMSPPLAETGQRVEERFTLTAVPVPPGFRLLIHDTLPERLGGETRRVVDRALGPRPVTVAAALPRTPRGEHRTGAATVWCEDVLGLTRVYVVSTATAFLRVLPVVRPVMLDETLRRRTRAEGPEMRLARLPTDEHFRLREYTPGDDVRRIHWRLSVNTGRLHVRLPETVPYARSKVLLVLDTYLPPHLAGGAALAGDVLDLLVEGWVGLAHALLARGEKVALAVAAPGPDGVVAVQQVACRRGDELGWRSLGARAAWQQELPPGRVIAAAGVAAGHASMVLTAGFGLPGSTLPGGSVLLFAEDPTLGIAAPKRSPWRIDIGRTEFPPGAEENRVGIMQRSRARSAKRRREAFGTALAAAARGGLAAARSVGIRTLLLRRRGVALRLEAAS